MEKHDTGVHSGEKTLTGTHSGEIFGTHRNSETGGINLFGVLDTMQTSVYALSFGY